jgi:hypothetical protein
LQNIQRTQRDPFSNPVNEKQAGRDVRGLGFSNISQQAVVGTGQVRSKPKGQDGIVGPYYATGVGSSEEQFDRRSNFYSSKFGRQDLYVWIVHFFQLLPLILIELVDLHQTKVGSTPRKKSMCGMTYILKQQIIAVTIL